MNTLKRIIFCSILFGTFLFSACSTDLDVIGNYKETIVVYGLLDQAQDTQYVKINKAFLGAGNALVYAQVKDSTQFVNALSVELRRIKNGVQLGATILLMPTNKPKDPGIFYSADQTNAIYSFVSTGVNALHPDSEYELTVSNNETGTVVTSKTSLVSDITGFTSPMPGGATFGFVSVSSPNYPFNVVWSSAKNARIYQVIIRLNYVDSLITGENVAHVVDYTLPSLKTLNISASTPELMEVDTKGRDFYKYIGNTLLDYTGLIKRTVGNVDLLLVAGSDELSTFIDVNTPSTGIIQERPEYTNINNGLGLFSARLNRAPDSRPLNATSWDSLVCGQYTKQLKFVNSSGIHPCL
jgi:hypothetical protein